MKFTRARTAALLAVVGVIAAAVWYTASSRRATREPRVYRIGWENDPPFQVALPNGEPSGLAIELVKEAAARAHVRLQWFLHQRNGQAALMQHKVDIWPLMTITPERKKHFHISDAFLEHGFYFMVRQDSPYRSWDELKQRSLSHINQTIVDYLAKQYFPQARLVPRATTREVDAEVCEGRVDGAFLEENGALSSLLDGIPCDKVPVRLIWAPTIHTTLGVASTFETADIADEIREKIGEISTEGR